jgi:ferric-dicitrate binding protein FerR (iron transport regulator)
MSPADGSGAPSTMPEKIVYLIARKLSNQASTAELEELSRLLQEQPEWNDIYKTLFSTVKPPPDKADQLAAQQAYAAHFVKMQLAGEFEEGGKRPPATGHKVKWYGVAVPAMVLLLAAGFWMYNREKQPPQNKPPVAKNEITTRKGSKSRVELPDGTQVWLNADSRISYPDNFKGPVREVRLIGEAFFEVTKDAAHPFVIHAGAVTIKVLGTVFNVRSYPIEKKVETSLLRGSVEVTLPGADAKKIVLKPNEKLIVESDSPGSVALPTLPSKPSVTLGKVHFEPRDSSSSIETLWVENKLAFEAEPFDIVAADIERWYNVEVIVKDERVRTLRFTGVFDNSSLEEVMEALQLTGRFQYTINGNRQVIVY